MPSNPEAHSIASAPSKPIFNSWFSWLNIYAAGLCMGVADIIPGISGGTIAFILGIYPNLILSLNSFDKQSFSYLLTGRFSAFFHRVGWEFLAALLAGIATSLVLLASVIDWLLNQPDSRALLYAGFSGLVLASVIFFSREVGKWRWSYLAAFLVGGVAAFFLTTHGKPHDSNAIYQLYFPLPANSTAWHAAENYDVEQATLHVDKETLELMLAKGLIHPEAPLKQIDGISQPVSTVVAIPKQSWWQPSLTISGMLTISATLLPGISGSYLLTILGLYPLIIGSLADFTASLRQFSWDQEAFLVLFNFGVGVVLGALLFARFIRWLFNRGPQMTIALLAGFMLGAMPSVWPFWHYRYLVNPLKVQKGLELQAIEPYLPSFDSPLLWQAIGCALLGFVLVFALETIVRSYQKRG